MRVRQSWSCRYEAHRTAIMVNYHIFRSARLIAIVLVIVVSTSCGLIPSNGPLTVPPTTQTVAPAPVVLSPSPAGRTVKASWYGEGFAGNKTSSGELYDPNRLTAASKTLPLGPVVNV